KALARAVAVLYGRKHRTKGQHEAFGVLMMGFMGLCDEVEGVAADLAHIAGALEHEAVVGTLDALRVLRIMQRIDAEWLIEQANEGADGARGVIVLGLAQQQGTAALDIAQIDVVAERGAARLSAGIDGQYDLGLRVVPL